MFTRRDVLKGLAALAVRLILPETAKMPKLEPVGKSWQQEVREAIASQAIGIATWKDTGIFVHFFLAGGQTGKVVVDWVTKNSHRWAYSLEYPLDSPPEPKRFADAAAWFFSVFMYSIWLEQPTLCTDTRQVAYWTQGKYWTIRPVPSSRWWSGEILYLPTRS